MLGACVRRASRGVWERVGMFSAAGGALLIGAGLESRCEKDAAPVSASPALRTLEALETKDPTLRKIPSLGLDESGLGEEGWDFSSSYAGRLVSSLGLGGAISWVLEDDVDLDLLPSEKRQDELDEDGEKKDIPKVASFDEMEGSTNVEIRQPEGLEILMVKMVQPAGLDPDPSSRPAQFMLQGNFHFSPPTPSRPDGPNAMITPIGMFGTTQMLCTMQPMGGGNYVLGPQFSMRGRNEISAHAALFPTRSKNPMAPKGLQSIGMSLRGRGRDFVVDLSSSLDARKGDEHSIEYFQGLSRSLGLGGKVALKTGPFLAWGERQKLAFGLAGMWMSDDGSRAALAKWDQQEEDMLLFRYHREVDEKSSLVSELVVSDDWTSKVQVAAELPLRYEPYYSGAYTTLRAAVDSHAVLRFGLEHAIGTGGDVHASLRMGTQLDHFKHKYKFGMAANFHQ